MNETILTTKQAREQLTISTSTFWKLVNDGKLNVIKLSVKKTGVLASEIDRYIESLKG